MAQRNKSILQSCITACIADNIVGDISAADIRCNVFDVTDSLVFNNDISGSVCIGTGSLFSNTTGTNNTAIGVTALNKNTTGTNNTAIGQNALFCNTIGANNIAFGQQAGCLFSGSSSNNIAIGFAAGPSTLTDESNKLYIASGSGTPLIKGDFAAKTVDISGSLTATSFTGSLLGTASFAQTASYVLNAVSSSFASTASFLNSTTNAFIQNGNSFGTTALLGTNDNQSLALETNGTTRMFISSSGNVGIGETAPTFKLVVTDTNNYKGILVNGSSAPNISFAKTTNQTAEWKAGISGNDGNSFSISSLE